MSVDERIRILLRAASRAEGEGDARVARILRRRAEEERPLDEAVPFTDPGLACAYGQ